MIWRSHRRQPRLLLGALVAVFGTTRSHAQTGERLRTLFKDSLPVAQDVGLSRPLSVDVFSDGSIVLVEYGSTAVLKLSAEGREIWRIGRQGSGPGELKIPYRVVVRPDQSVLVFDLGNARYSSFTKDGKHIGDLRSNITVDVANMLSLPDGRIALSGFTRDPRGRDHAIHLLSSTLQHIRSFGPLPEAPHEQLVRAIGVGGMTLDRDGNLLLTRYAPLELLRYSADGALRRSVPLEVTVDPPAKVATLISQGNRMTTRVNQNSVRGSPVDELADGTLLMKQRTGTTDTLWLLSANGRRVDRMPVPQGWDSMLSHDRRRHRLWILGERDEEPLFYRVDLPPPLTPRR